MGSQTETSLALPRAMTLAEAMPLAEALKARQGQPISLEASEVEHVGAQCLQVLLSAAMTWQQQSVSFSVLQPSDAFTEGLERLGVATDFFSN